MLKPMICTLLGTGTSHGIPVIGCSCSCCRSSDPRDTRFRTAAWFRSGTGDGESSVIIDTGPELRLQALANGISHIDAVFITHSHADHLHGIDDLRIFCHKKQPDKTISVREIPLYGSQSVISDIENRFHYAFNPNIQGDGRPHISLHAVHDEPVQVGSLRFRSIRLMHSTTETHGWLVSTEDSAGNTESIAYLTDCKELPDTSLERLKVYGGHIRHLIIDGLRKKEHKTHLSFSEAARLALLIGADHVWLTHICHDMKHTEIEQYLNDLCKNDKSLAPLMSQGRTIAPAYDGLSLST